MCGSYFAISTPKKVSERHFTCRFYLSTIAPALRYLKTLSPDGMPISPAVRYRFTVPVLPARASHLLSLLPRVFPPRRLPPRFSRRFPPAPVPISCLPATSSQFAISLPSNRACPCISHSVAASSRTAASYNSVYIASRHPFRIAVQILHRLDRLVAWLREGREG